MSQKTVQDYLTELAAIAQGQDAAQAQTAPDLARSALAVFKQDLTNALPNLQFTGWAYGGASGTAFNLQEDAGRVVKVLDHLRTVGTKILRKPVPPKQPTQRIENPYLKEGVNRLKSMLTQCQRATERQREKATTGNLTMFYSVFDNVSGVAQDALAELRRSVQDAIPRMELSKDWDPNKVDTEVELVKLAAGLMVQGFRHMAAIEPLRTEF